jgi:tetratricopeptide (TPR) repeat protein
MKSLVFLLGCCLAIPALGDVVHLKDGSTLEGSIKRTRDGYVVSDADGKTTTVPADSVASIELKKPGGSQSAQEGLDSLRRSVANLDDLKQIISRYKSFIDQHASTPIGAEAQKDLAQWQDRLDKGMVKAGKDWVTHEQLAALQAGAHDAVAKATPLIAAGKMKEAMALIDPALAVAPASGELLYLKGLVLYRQGQLVPARNAFQAVATSMPENAAAHNNIAVILWKTRAQMPALLEFDKAMAALPSSQTILDNVAEALHALPREHQKNDLTKRTVEHFNSQDAALQRQMAQHGLYRFGSQWLSQQEYESIQQQQKAVQDKIDALQRDFDGNQQRLIQIAETIDSDQQLMRQMEAQSFQVDPVTGQVVRFPLPQRYYDLQHDQELLKVEMNTRQRQQTELQRLAAEQRSKLPDPHYTGTMKAFDVEGLQSAAKSATAESPGTATEVKASVPAKPPTTAPAATRPAKPAGGADF